MTKRYIKDDNEDFFDPNDEENHGKKYTLNGAIYTLYNKGGKSYKLVKFNENPKPKGRPKKILTPEEIEEAKIKSELPKRKPGRPRKISLNEAEVVHPIIN